MFKDKACNGKIPQTFKPSLNMFLQAIGCLPFVIIGGKYFPFQYVITNEFAQMNFFKR